MSGECEPIKLTVEVENDEYTQYLSDYFDYSFTGTSTFTLPHLEYSNDFNIGLIVGSSGSGKTQLLKHHFDYEDSGLEWSRNKSILSHFETPELGVKKLMACGLSSIPSLCKPYHVLSNGEQFRADMARQLYDGAVIDEYTSVVNRETAVSLSIALEKYVRKNNIKNIIISSVHRDIIKWLQPDWIFDTDSLNLINVDMENNRKRVAKIEIE